MLIKPVGHLCHKDHFKINDFEYLSGNVHVDKYRGQLEKRKKTLEKAIEYSAHGQFAEVDGTKIEGTVDNEEELEAF